MFITVGLFLLLVNLGLWQLDRGQQKQQLEAQLESRSSAAPLPLESMLNTQTLADSEHYYGVNVESRLIPSNNPIVLLDNQTLDGKVGYIVYQPMRVDNAASSDGLILVDLGFAEALPRRDQLPQLQTLQGATALTGRLYSKSINPLSKQHLESFEHQQVSVLRVQSVDTEYLTRLWQQKVWPVLVQPTSLTSWSQPMIWKPFPMSSAKHFGYSVQWFAMASVFLGLMIWIGIRALRAHKHKKHIR